MYNYLFYKGYQAAIRSNNWADMPELGGCAPVAWCVLMNVLSLSFLAERVFTWDASRWIRPEYKWIFSAVALVATIVFYFSKKRYSMVKSRYDKSPFLKNIPPFIVIVMYEFTSLVFMLLAGMFRNHGWIF